MNISKFNEFFLWKIQKCVIAQIFLEIRDEGGIGMYYKWRYFLTGFCIVMLCLGGGITVQFLTQNFETEEPQAHDKLAVSELTEAILYNEEQHLIYWKIAETDIDLRVNNTEIETLMSKTSKGEYKIFFLPEQTKEQYFNVIFQKDGRNVQRILSYDMMKRTHKISSFFVGKEGYFIQADKTYVCSRDLEQRDDGTCHPESYYLD